MSVDVDIIDIVVLVAVAALAAVLAVIVVGCDAEANTRRPTCRLY